MGDQFTLSRTDDVAPEETYGNRLDIWKKEISQAYQVMKKLVDMDPSDIFRHLSQFSARASEIRSLIGPQESKREYAFRTRIIDPFIEECDRQFKIHSRRMAIFEMDARLAGGRFT